MATKEFYGFVDKICELARISHPQSLYARTDIQVDDIKFTLMDASSKNERCMNVYCDFGPLPNGTDRLIVLYRLLDLNLINFSKKLPCFAIDATSNHAILTASLPFDAETALDTLNALGKLAAHAKQWQKNYLLPGEDAAPASAKRRGSAVFFQGKPVAQIGL